MYYGDIHVKNVVKSNDDLISLECEFFIWIKRNGH